MCPECMFKGLKNTLQIKQSLSYTWVGLWPGWRCLFKGRDLYVVLDEIGTQMMAAIERQTAEEGELFLA